MKKHAPIVNKIFVTNDNDCHYWNQQTAYQ